MEVEFVSEYEDVNASIYVYSSVKSYIAPYAVVALSVYLHVRYVSPCSWISLLWWCRVISEW